MEPTEEPGNDQQKLGLGFEDADEVQYEKLLIGEIEGLVLREKGLERERLANHKEGFDDDDLGFEKEDEREGFDGDVGFENEDVREGFDKEDEIVGFYGDEGFYKENEREGFDGDMGFYKEDEREGFNGKDVKKGFYDDERERFSGYVGFDSEDVRKGFYDDVGFGEESGREGFNSGKNDWGYNGNNSYPVRPDAEDCQYYMRYGSCKYGSSCKFNHPLKRRNQYPKAAKDKEDYSERPGKIECKYHASPGGCKYGTACKFSHSRGKTSATPAIEFNFLGLPIRPGETECPFYMRNGSCKYGSNCRFNHPQPTKVGVDSPSGYNNDGNVPLHAAPQTNVSSWSSRNAFNGSGSVSPYSPTNGASASNREWNSYQAPVYPATERRLPNPPAFALNNDYAETNFYTHNKPPMIVDDFPERPGEPECSYFMKTGDCKYRSGCRFNHPKNRNPNLAACALSDKGLPLRPDQQVCTYYTRYGLCKYGPACRYDHPVHYDNSASSPLSRQANPLPVTTKW